MRKYTKAENTEVLSPQAHKVVESNLQKLGKNSARDLTDEERATALSGIEKADK